MQGLLSLIWLRMGRMSGFYSKNDAKFTQGFHNTGIAEISSQFYPLEVEADINYLTNERVMKSFRTGGCR
jgi:hypothetical protein